MIAGSDFKLQLTATAAILIAHWGSNRGPSRISDNGVCYKDSVPTLLYIEVYIRDIHTDIHTDTYHYPYRDIDEQISTLSLLKPTFFAALSFNRTEKFQ